MKKIKSTLELNTLFYISCFLFLISGVLVLLNIAKADSFILLNKVHSFWLNVFFVNYTFFGDGIFALALCAFLYYRKQKKLALCLIVGYLSSGLATQLLKNLIYAPRPRIYFEASQYLFHLDNFRNSGGGFSSFPSGHTTSAFALATILALNFRKPIFSILLFAGALLVGYSRIYLAQHFPVDVLAGSFIGIVFSTISYIYVNNNIRIVSPKKIKHFLNIWKNRQLPDTAVS